MYTFKKLNVSKNQNLYQTWVKFLERSQIRPEKNLDAVYGIYDGEKLIATGSTFNNILKCIAVDCEYQGGQVLGQLITELLSAVWDMGHTQTYVYTKPSTQEAFTHLGFKEIARVENHVVFMEKAIHGFSEYCSDIEKFKCEGEKISSIVMNANPFTNGHLHLITQASLQSDHVYVFVVSEDASLFPSAVRKELVTLGTAHLTNVTILDTGNYMVSSQTFPSYFLAEDVDTTRIQAELDARIFKEKIAPLLGITRRFVGEEPISFATSIYNEALKKVLEPEIELQIIKRIQRGSEVISASYVRQLMKEHDFESIKEIVPKTSYDYIRSDKAQDIMNKLENGGQ